jgi:hypothetical protein
MEMEAVLASISSFYFPGQVTISLDCMRIIFLFRLILLVFVWPLEDVIPESNWPSVLISTIALSQQSLAFRPDRSFPSTLKGKMPQHVLPNVCKYRHC